MKEETQDIDWAVCAWTNCLKQLDIETDIAFFGDSITYGGNWAEYFPEDAVINLGFPGDTLTGMCERVDQLEIANPEKIFVMGGINGLRYLGMERTVEEYSLLIEEITMRLPETTIYIESLLPVAEEQETTYGSNEMIKKFNRRLEELAGEMSIKYIDLWNLYEKDGFINGYCTTDGIHLKEEAYSFWVEEIQRYMN